MKRWLIDTGPCIAYLDRRDSYHDAVSRRLDTFVGQLITTPAVVTEAMHFIATVSGGPAAFAEFLVRARVHVATAVHPRDVVAAAALMEKYADTPMDYADATLVRAGEALAVLDILTTDRRGFSTYRTARGRPFRLVLDA
jgi:predicted nucleic acid-binding protein